MTGDRPAAPPDAADPDAAATPPPGGLLFSLPGLGLLAAVAGTGAWFGLRAALLPTSMLLALALLVRGWSAVALARLVFTRRLERTRAFPGEVVRCDCALDNRKLLPLAWVEAADRLPAAITPDEAELPAGFARTPEGLSLSTALLWYQRATWSHGLRCRRRGVYPVGPSRVSTADLFGLLPRARTGADIETLIVYPRLLDGLDGIPPSRSPLGENRSVDPLHGDPTRFRGLRDHVPGIPMRHIHWKASARTGTLQAKTFDPSCALRVMVVLDLSALADADVGAEDGPFETALSVAATLAWRNARARNPVGLAANVGLTGGANSALLPARAGMEHAALILETLARAARPSIPFPALVEAAAPLLGAGTTLVVVTAGLTPGARAWLESRRRAGIPAALHLVGDATPVAGFPNHRVGGAA